MKTRPSKSTASACVHHVASCITSLESALSISQSVQSHPSLSIPENGTVKQRYKCLEYELDIKIKEIKILLDGIDPELMSVKIHGDSAR